MNAITYNAAALATISASVVAVIWLASEGRTLLAAIAAGAAIGLMAAIYPDEDPSSEYEE